MKILFVGRAKDEGTASIILERQADSLTKLGHVVQIFALNGSGLFSYFRSLPSLWHTVRSGKFDIIHAHYSVTALAVSLLPVRNLVVSLMGSDVMAASPGMLILIRLAAKFRWTATIVKTSQMKEVLNYNQTIVLPNGVDTSLFKPVSGNEIRTQLGLDTKKVYVLFPSDPGRAEKNYELAAESVKLIKKTSVELIAITGINPAIVADYMNAADVVIVTSVREGSPNVLKEAMACGRPVVSTDVGDAAYILAGIDGCFIAGFNPVDFAQKLEMAIDFSLSGKTTNGRERIFELQLDAPAVAGKLASLYSDIINSD